MQHVSRRQFARVLAGPAAVFATGGPVALEAIAAPRLPPAPDSRTLHRRGPVWVSRVRLAPARHAGHSGTSWNSLGLARTQRERHGVSDSVQVLRGAPGLGTHSMPIRIGMLHGRARTWTWRRSACTDLRA